ncbi:MAG: histidinol-phosphate transaminase [Betaproteobacteria bacterium]|nr:MAG: histidinol-phosphate transaminase [Betaproteobacteria bacterium]
MSEGNTYEVRVPALPYVRSIAPYQPGKPISEVARELGLAEADIVKLASNENPLGASPHAMQAAQAELTEVARYPDGSGFLLRNALADYHNVSPEMLVLGNGSNDVLELASIAFLGPGLSAVYAQHCFVVNQLATKARGAEGIEVPANDFGHDLQAMRKAVRDDTRIIFVSNPNNPTGTFVTPAEVRDFLQQVPANVLVVLDEAYYEYLAPGQQSGSIAWISEFPNLLVTRTFSKAHGLAGLRVGYGVAHPSVADLMNRIRQPFNVSNVAQAAALAALGDAEFIERSVELNRVGMKQLTDGFASLGLEWIESSGNFVTLRVGDAGRVFKQLLERGVIVRPVAGYGLPEHLRVSIGLESENSRLLETLGAVLKAS